MIEDIKVLAAVLGETVCGEAGAGAGAGACWDM
jgi:hypothetical protein